MRLTPVPISNSATFTSRLLAEIHTEIDGLAAQFAASEASVAPVRAAMDALYGRTLQAEIPADTYPARLR